MTLAELYRELERHDWFHEMSDDHRVYSAGQYHWRKLQFASKGIEGGPQLLEKYTKHVFSGPAFGTPKAAKPEKPEGVTV